MQFVNTKDQEYWSARCHRHGDRFRSDGGCPQCDQERSAELSSLATMLALLLLCLPAIGQVRYSGSLSYTGSGMLEVSQPGAMIGENAYCSPGVSGEMTEGTPTWGSSDGVAFLDNRCFYTGMDATPSNGYVHQPSNASDLTTLFSGGLLNGHTLACGDVISLTAGSIYQAPSTSFVLPNLNCDGAHWITIASSAVPITGKQTGNANFPAEHTQATPCAAGIANTNGNNLPGYPDYPCPAPTNLMAKIQGPSNGASAIQAILPTGTSTCSAPLYCANHYRFIGIEITKMPNVQTNILVNLMGTDKFTEGGQKIIFDRGWIHGEPYTLGSGSGAEMSMGIRAANSQWVAEINGWNTDSYCNASCIDSHTFGFGTGAIQDGPFKIYNEVYASSGETFMGGGSGTGPGTPNTRGIEIRSNLLLKPLSWMMPIDSCIIYPHKPITKNNGELKNGTYALIEGNAFWNSWQGCQSDQDGFGVLMDAKSQNNNFSLKVQFNGTSTVTSKDGTFLHGCGGQSNCSPADYQNCPPGGCILELADESRSDDGSKYRFCNGTNAALGQNGCVQTGDLSTTASVTTTVAAGGKCSNSSTTSCNADSDCGAGNYCYTQTNSCVPGDCPSCKVENVVVRYNDFYNLINGIQIASAISSHCNDEAAGADHLEIRDNVFHGLSVEMTNGPGTDNASLAITVGNGQLSNVINSVEFAHNTVAIESEGGPQSTGGMGIQKEGTDIEYLQGLNIHDNISVASWHVLHTKGTHLGGGLATAYQTDACRPYYPTEAAKGLVLADGTAFSFAPDLGSHYIVTNNGVSQALAAQHPTDFTTEASQHAGDSITVRDTNDCDWIFIGNILGTSLAGGSLSESPYPSGNAILDGTAFTSIFSNWQARRGGDYSITASSGYQGTATDSWSRGATGKDPGADLSTWASLVNAIPNRSIYYPPLSILTGSLPTATAGSAYQAALTTGAYGSAGGGASPYKSWWVETDASNCGGNCGSLPTSAGIVMGRDGTVNGLFRVQTASRASGVSTFNPIENPVAGAWTVGQTIVLSGFDNTKDDDDPSFNGTCTITSVTTLTLSCAQTGEDIESHTVNAAANLSFAPITPGAYTFWVGVKDGAFQQAWKQISVTVN